MGFTATSRVLVQLLVHACHAIIHIQHDFNYSILATVFQFIPSVTLTVLFFPPVYHCLFSDTHLFAVTQFVLFT